MFSVAGDGFNAQSPLPRDGSELYKTKVLVSLASPLGSRGLFPSLIDLVHLLYELISASTLGDSIIRYWEVDGRQSLTASMFPARRS